MTLKWNGKYRYNKKYYVRGNKVSDLVVTLDWSSYDPEVIVSDIKAWRSRFKLLSDEYPTKARTSEDVISYLFTTFSGLGVGHKYSGWLTDRMRDSYYGYGKFSIFLDLEWSIGLLNDGLLVLSSDKSND